MAAHLHHVSIPTPCQDTCTMSAYPHHVSIPTPCQDTCTMSAYLHHVSIPAPCQHTHTMSAYPHHVSIPTPCQHTCTILASVCAAHSRLPCLQLRPPSLLRRCVRTQINLIFKYILLKLFNLSPFLLRFSYLTKYYRAFIKLVICFINRKYCIYSGLFLLS
jgi:hypothetical protein